MEAVALEKKGGFLNVRVKYAGGMNGMVLILYGVPTSQPVRAVAWLLLMKDVPFELRMVLPLLLTHCEGTILRRHYHY